MSYSRSIISIRPSLYHCYGLTHSYVLSEVVVLSVVCSVPNNLAADDSSGAVVVGDTVAASNN